MPHEVHAVLIADVVHSTSRRDIRAMLGERLAGASKRHLRRKLIRLPYSVTAGDEFQTVAASLTAIPEIILDLWVRFRPLSLRIGVGFGHIPGRIQPPVNRLTGEAFQYARWAIDRVKAKSLFKFEVLTAFASHNEAFDQTINLLYGLHDTLALQITAKQWEAIRQFLEQPSLEQSAKRLKLDVSTVSRNLKRGYYWQLVETIKVAGSLIQRTFL
jgi:SatD family (SatD)